MLDTRDFGFALAAAAAERVLTVVVVVVDALDVETSGVFQCSEL